MARQKKIKTVQEEEKPEVNMSESAVLENLQTEIDLARVELEKTRREIAEKKEIIETGSRRELDRQEVVLVERQHTMSNEKKALKEKIEAQKAFDNQKVTGKFINRRAPGQPAKLAYIKYEDDPVKWYTLEDNKVYTIPRGFADQLNEHYYTPHFIQSQGEMDPSRPCSAIHDVDTSNKKYSFVPTQF